MTTLNPVGARIWEELDGRRGVRELASDLITDFNGVDVATLTTDITEFIETLRESGLVEDSD